MSHIYSVALLSLTESVIWITVSINYIDELMFNTQAASLEFKNLGTLLYILPLLLSIALDLSSIHSKIEGVLHIIPSSILELVNDAYTLSTIPDMTNIMFKINQIFLDRKPA